MSSLFGKKNKSHNTGSKQRNAQILLFKRKQDEISANNGLTTQYEQYIAGPGDNETTATTSSSNSNDNNT